MIGLHMWEGTDWDMKSIALVLREGGVGPTCSYLFSWRPVLSLHVICSFLPELTELCLDYTVSWEV